VALGVLDTWRRLNGEQRVAGVAALLLIVSTFGPFSFVEAAIVLIGLSVLFLLRRRAEGREFHVPFGDGTIIAAAGAWSAVLILIRIFDRPLGQGLLALVCAGLLLVAGLSERRKHLPDDLPDEDAARHQRDSESVDPRDQTATERLPAESRRRRRRTTARIEDEPTAVRERRPTGREQLFDPESGAIDELRSVHDEPTEPLPPPEFDLPPRRRSEEETSELPPPPPPPPERT
jgi:hypothetical protein